MTFCHLYELVRVSILSMSRFLETDTREQQKYEKRIQSSVDNTVNDLNHEIKFQRRVKTKITFLLSKTFISSFKQKKILILEKYFFKIPKNSIASVFFIFFTEVDAKKYGFVSAKALAFADCWGEFWTLHRVLDMPKKPAYILILCQYAWIWLNNAEYDWICLHIPE